MELTGERLIPASIQRTWEALNDPDTLRRSMPGCETLERAGDDGFSAQLTLRIGPVNARFKGTVTLSDVVPARSYTLAFEGTGGVAGFAKGNAEVQLAEEGPDATRLRYRSTAKVGGKIAQVGSRLVEATAAKISDEFFQRFEDIVREQARTQTQAEATATPVPAGEPPPTVPTRATSPMKPWMWGALAIVAAVVVYVVTR